MSSRLSRLVIVVVTICAFLGAGLVQNLPFSAKAAPVGMTMMADDAGDSGASMPCHETSAPPCNDQVPGCMTDLGCVFTVALPALPTRAAERFVWDSISYWPEIGFSEGVSPEPIVGPPIRIV
ncbi:hypothetical protein EAH89_10865 [Roseomonas nepalensis]|uniref:Uncharacterized protein n=1 Tax=Muricoccus nepalensis TaxID=1854500 RepID=A0A502G649_9PROT|nr:hypothetical protein [Roseomonas nepalensis]TPG57425.1 hypothetical protein EAH89_10865 [Roseomonas nepalensis]